MLVAVLGLLLLWRVAALLLNGHDLFVDEAQYVVWARDLAAGYYSKPPLLAWLIGGAVRVCGEGQACVRGMASLLYALAALVLFHGLKPVLGARPALYGALALVFAPLPALYGLFVSTDAPLLLASALFVHRTLAVLRDPRAANWLGLGAVSGVGLLAKYSFALLPVALALHLLLSADGRRHLRTVGPWLAALAALAVCSPNLLWNAQHAFITFTHTAEISQVDRSGVHPGGLALFLAGQLLAFGPASFWVLLSGTAATLRPAAPAQRQALHCLITLGAVPLAFFALLALLSRANLNWPMFAFVPLAALAGWAMAAQSRERALRVTVATTVLLLAVIQHFPGWVRLSGLQPAYRADPFGRLQGWQDASRQAADWLARHPDADPLTDSRTVAAELLYYAPALSSRLAMWNPTGRVGDHYRLTRDLAARPPGGHYLYLGAAPDLNGLRAGFDRVQPLGRIEVRTHRDHAIRLDVVALDGFRGYAGVSATSRPDAD